MFEATDLLPRLAMRRTARTWTTLAHSVANWLLRRWQISCRHAERADRFVPYY